MAKRVVEEASLTAVADAIRETGVTNEQLVFPTEYEAELAKIHEQWKMLVGLSTYEKRIVFPKGITHIRTWAFYNFQHAVFPSVLPEGITLIDEHAFHNCFKIYELVLPTTLQKLGSQAFCNSMNIKQMTFKSVMATIASDAFLLCPGLTTINVPWAEGAVSGAPWGATNATINYNYVAEG